jgi:hypothetical protein
VPPDDADGELGHGIPPKLETTPRLLAVQGGWVPLSRSLRPARPPEEGERGAGEAPGSTEKRVGGAERIMLV